MSMSFRLVAASAFLLVSSTALAQSNADVTTTLTGPAGVYVYQTGAYNVVVRNIGRKTASSVKVTIQLPRTNTSPTVYIMGELGSRDSRCAVSGTRLVCTIGTLAKSASTNVGFNLKLPYNTAPNTFTATVSTTSIENSGSNNQSTITVTPATYSVLINPAPSIAAINRHCTGTGLTSFFECELFPSSISEHDSVFEVGGAISFPGNSGYYGTWSKPAADRLVFDYFELGNPDAIAHFEGRGTILGSCFEGKTTFPLPSTYVSMYEVCLVP